MRSEFYKNLFINSPQAYGYHKVVVNENNQPIDYIFVDVNEAFERLTGLDKKQIIGKQITEILPDIKEGRFNWIKYYGEIAIEGIEKEFEEYSQPLKKWYKVTAFSPQKNYFATVFSDISDQKNKNIQLEGFFETNLNLLSIADTDCNFIKVNTEWEKVLGYSAKELESKKFTDFIHPDDINSTIHAVKKLANQEKVTNFMNRYRAKDGTYKHLEWKAYPKANLIYSAARDITNHKDLLEELKYKTEELEILIDTIDTQIWYLKDEKTYGLVNKAHASFFGLSKEDLTGKKLKSLLTDEEADICITNNIEIFKSKKTITSEEWVVDGNGKERLLHIIKNPKLDENNEVKFVVCSAEDITEQKNSYEKLEKSEKRYKGLVNSINHMIVRVDNNNRFTFVNDLYCKTFGKTRQELIGKSFVPLIHEEDREHTIKEMEKLNSPPYRVELEQRALTVNGWRWIFWEDDAILDDDGNIIEIHGVGRDITNEKENKQNLIKKNLLLESIMSNVPTVVYSFKLDDNNKVDITYVNDTVTHILGHSPSDLIGNYEFWASCIHPDDTKQIKASLKNLNTSLKDGQEWKQEYRFKDKKGNYHWLSDHCTVFTNIDGNYEIVGAWTDVTENKERELEILKNKERLALAQKFALLGYWEYNIQTEKLFWSEECEKLFSMSPGSFEGTFKSFLNRVHPDDVDYVKSINLPIVLNKEGITLDYEHRIITKNSEVKWIKEIAGAVFDNNTGKPTHIIGFAMDITNQKQREDALENEEKLRQIINNIDGLFWLLSESKNELLYISPAYENIFNTIPDKKKMKSDFFIDSVHIDDKKRVTAAYKEFLRSGVFNEEYRVHISNEEVKYLYTQVFPVKNDIGNTIRYAGITVDVTEKVINNNDLIAAKEKAEESNRLKSAFLASLSHELRTPLNHIIGFSDLLRATLKDENNKTFANQIYESGTNFLAMVEDIFNLALVEQSEVIVRLEKFSVLSLFLENKKILIENVSSSGKSSDIELRYKPDHNALNLLIEADRIKINQILINLFNNAVKFTKKGYIEFGILMADENSISFYIKDTGIGIPENKINIIFDFFRQANDSLSRHFEGLGIGLAISNKLADILNAKIDVESVVDKGSKFTLTIPVNISNDNQKQESHFGEIETSNLEGVKVFIIDDDKHSINIAKQILLRNNAEVFHGDDADTSLELIEKINDIDIYLVDLKMPEIDGYQILKKVKNVYPKKPVYAFTAHALKSEKEKVVNAGFDGIITKPFNSTLLVAEVKKITKRL